MIYSTNDSIIIVTKEIMMKTLEDYLKGNRDRYKKWTEKNPDKVKEKSRLNYLKKLAKKEAK